MKYFFLSNGWTHERVWELGGLWDTTVWRRKPHIKALNLGLVEQGEVFWLYEVEEAVLMVEVKAIQETNDINKPFAQVVLKRLINGEQVIQRLCQAEAIIHRRD